MLLFSQPSQLTARMYTAQMRKLLAAADQIPSKCICNRKAICARLRHLPMRQAAIPFRSLCCSSDLFRIALIASLPMLNSAQVPTQASVPKSSEFFIFLKRRLMTSMLQ